MRLSTEHPYVTRVRRAKEIFDRLVGVIRSGGLGDGARGITAIGVTLRESHVAWAAYEARVE